MNHKFIKGNNDYTLILLHGTGGTIDDLLPIASIIDENANILAFEGDVLESGQRRFFKRFMDGSYDINDLSKRSKKFNETVVKQSHNYNFDLKKACYIGFSNGANLLLYDFLNSEPAVKKLISFHGMLKNMPTNKESSNHLHVFFTIGMFDPLTTYKASLESLEHFSFKSINLCKCITREGHQITEKELLEAKKWYLKNKD